MSAPRRFVYDELTGWIDELAVTETVRLATSEERMYITGALEHLFGLKPRRDVTIQGLDRALDRAENRLRAVAAQWSMDLNQAILRRFPLIVFDTNWLPTVMMAIEKYSAVDTPEVVQKTEDGNQLVAKLDETTIVESFRLAAAAQMMCELVSIRRAVTKGARFRPTAGNPYQLQMPGSLSGALTSYDARRNMDFQVFQQQGVLAGDMSYSDGPFGYFLARVTGYVVYYVPERDFRLAASYLLVPFAISDLSRALEPYRNAIEELYEIKLEDVFHVLAALATLIGTSIRYFNPEPPDRLVLLPASDPDNNAGMLKFTFDLLRKGNLRFHRTDWERHIGRVESPWFPDKRSSSESARRFFKAFEVHPGADLDLRSLRPFPFVFHGASDSLYVDLAATVDWLESIVEAAQQVLESQHGDLFQLAVTQLLRAQGPGKTVIPRWPFIDARGNVRQGDILIVTPEAVYCVECKAFRKRGAYLRGDLGPIQRRAEDIRDALQQAREAAAAVLAGRTSAVALNGQAVEPVVCTASPEFLNPIGKFGMLAEGIPRVCSARELATFISR